jgi:hypothetical protein
MICSIFMLKEILIWLKARYMYVGYSEIIKFTFCLPIVADSLPAFPQFIYS